MKDYHTYRWFYTSTGKLVLGGKNARQNDELMSAFSTRDRFVMHTEEPGSPFCIIDADKNKVNNEDLKECAIFTGCFSKAWKEGKKETIVDIFMTGQTNKTKDMKEGTWGVKGKIKKVKVPLKLVLTKQKGTYRAVPEGSAKKKLFTICPGPTKKETMVHKFNVELRDQKLTQEQLLAALPAGGVRICR